MTPRDPKTSTDGMGVIPRQVPTGSYAGMGPNPCGGFGILSIQGDPTHAGGSVSSVYKERIQGLGPIRMCTFL